MTNLGRPTPNRGRPVAVVKQGSAARAMKYREQAKAELKGVMKSCVAEVKALHVGYLVVNENTPAVSPRDASAIIKAVIFFCMAKKSRDADHLQNRACDRLPGLPPETLADEFHAAGDYVPIPDYAFD